VSASRGPVVVLGAGSAGEHFVGALRRLDEEVEIVVVERALAGGECSYYACLPTKTLLRPVEALAAARLAPGAAEAVTRTVDVERVRWWRDQVTDGRDDSWHAGWLADREAELVRGDARVVRPGVVAVGERELAFGTLVVATGSSPAIPSIPGIEDVDVWTSRDAVWASKVPETLVVLGGGPVGVELAQLFARLGSRVTVVEPSRSILSRLDPDAGALLRQRFEEEEIEVRVEARVERVQRAADGVHVGLREGGALEAERLLLATGRRPGVEGIGLEGIGVEIGPRGIAVDGRMRAAGADGVYAIGDAAGVALLTHVGKYQARVAAANIAGREVVADYRAIPAAVFTDPQVASVGHMDGDGVVTARYEIAGGRLSTYERPRRNGLVKLAANRERRVLVGALAIGPEAGEWLGQLTLAVRAAVPLDVLLDTIQPYPTFSEAIFNCLLALEDELRTS
jgi:pyruvate/2-oxoglutarate dehydrogenase complex dihydrolipoamide dehydrogenase (E3) component